MKRHLTKSVYILACSAGVFFRVRECFYSRKRHVETSEERMKWVELKAAGRGGGKGEKRKSHLLSQNMEPS